MADAPTPCFAYTSQQVSLLSYKTTKVAVIRDWRLGLLHKTLQAGTLVYVLVFSLLLEKQWAVVGVIESQVDMHALQVRGDKVLSFERGENVDGGKRMVGWAL